MVVTAYSSSQHNGVVELGTEATEFWANSFPIVNGLHGGWRPDLVVDGSLEGHHYSLRGVEGNNAILIRD